MLSIVEKRLKDFVDRGKRELLGFDPEAPRTVLSWRGWFVAITATKIFGYYGEKCLHEIDYRHVDGMQRRMRCHDLMSEMLRE